MITRRKLYIFCFITLFGFGSAGYALIRYFQEPDFLDVLQGNADLFTQIWYGTLAGVLISLVAIIIVHQRWMKPVRFFFSDLIKGLQLRFVEVLFISFCAGAGEEILFRGGIQPFLGVWITSTLFVAIHGYLNPYNWRLSIYGVFMVFAISLIGYLSIEIGLITAITSHFFIDVFLLLYLQDLLPGLKSSR